MAGGSRRSGLLELGLTLPLEVSYPLFLVILALDDSFKED